MSATKKKEKTAEGAKKFKEVTDHSILISKDDEGTMRIDPDALRDILLSPSIDNKPIAIISVVGQKRTGKSFLLNFFLRYLRKRGWQHPDWMGNDDEGVGDDGIKWKRGGTRCTTGIRIFKHIFEIEVSGGEKMVVLLMDTQGLFDHKTPEVVNKTLLTLSTLASSVQMFNCMRQIDSQHLDYLQTCVDFALATAREEKGAYVQLQRLVMLIRDCIEADDSDGDGTDDSHGTDDDKENAVNCGNYDQSNKNEGETRAANESDAPTADYGIERGRKLLDEILDSDEGGEQQLAVRKGMRESFVDLQCFAMPSVGEKAEGKKFKGMNSELKQEFRYYVKMFVEGIASPQTIFPKRIGEKKMTGRDILNMLCACDKIFAERKFGTLNIMEANQKAYYASKYEEAILEYMNEMKIYIEVQREIDEIMLERKHEEAKKRATEAYNGAAQMRAGGKEEYLKHLEEKCEEYVNHEKRKLAVKLEADRMKRDAETQLAFSEYQGYMKKLTLDKDEEQEHEKHYAAIRQKYEGLADLTSLGLKVKELYQELRIEKQTRREKLEKLKSEKKKEEIYRLVVALKNQCVTRWLEETKVVRSEKEMDEARANIKNDAETEYWNKALNSDEKLYQEILRVGLQTQFELVKLSIKEKAIGQYLKVYIVSAPTGHDDRKTEKAKYCHFVDKAMEEFGLYLQHEKERLETETDLEHALRSLEEIKDNFQQKHMDSFLDLCSPHVMHFHNELSNSMKTEHMDALRRNADRRNLHLRMVSNEIEKWVLREEDQWKKVMADRHVKEEVIESSYARAVKDMKESVKDISLCSDLLSGDCYEEAKKEVEKTMEEKFQESLSKVKEENEKIKEMRVVNNSEASPSPRKSKSRFCPLI